MHLHIAPNRLISDIQHEFNKVFPFLKLEFFSKKRSLSGPGFTASQLIPYTSKVSVGQSMITDGDIEIPGEMKVIELEKLLKEQFSLSAQVLRKSGNLWLETTMTDNWTLEQQNRHGKEISTGKKEALDLGDYDLSRGNDD
ncbi:MAG: hypothetical protein ABIT05_10165 [Chitinophagaceae bacterium]